MDFIDPRDGKVYKIVEIGSQIWMAQNLAYNVIGSKCYENKRTNGKTYGRLYDWETAMSVCPPGWHLPSKKEWNILVNFAGGAKIAGKKIKAKTGWNDYRGISGNGTDDFGFNALPGGYCNSNFHDDEFYKMGEDENWWSSSRTMVCLGINYKHECTGWFPASDGSCFLSVRCIKNSKEVKDA